MKVLICGECPDSLTTVAQSLNRLLSQQMRPDVSIPTPLPASASGPLEISGQKTPKDLFAKDHD
jgi:hypothetical protein